MATATDTTAGETLARFVQDVEYGDLPGNSVRVVEQAILDTVGVTLAGVPEAPGRNAAAVVSRLSGGAGSTTLLGRDERADLLRAVYVNAITSHCLDYDDGSSAMIGHPSVVLVPPILGLAERKAVTGRDAITAYVAGFEVMSYVGSPILPDHYEHGWHATGTLGPFGSAAVAAQLLDLSESKTATALETVVSLSSGVRQNFGTMAKPMHVGEAARAGLQAALLAEEGFSAARDAIEGDSGFWTVYAGASDPDQSDLFVPGETWTIRDVGIYSKKFPCCWAAHPCIAAAMDLCERHDLAPEDVESVQVTAAPAVGNNLAYHDPQTGFEGKFSMEYTVASAIVRGSVTLDAFEDDAVSDPDVQRMMDRITFEVDEDLPFNADDHSVVVKTRDGDAVTGSVENPPGDAENRLSDAEYRTKFLECATTVYAEDDAERLYTTLDDLQNCEDVGRVVADL